MTRRRVIIAASVLSLLAAGWTASRVRYSPRLEVIEPHIRLGATRDEFMALFRDRRFPYEADDSPHGIIELRIPLDGTLWRRRLQLRFRFDGLLVWAAVINQAGEIDEFRLPLTVQLVSATVAPELLQRPPPSLSVELPLIVDLVSVAEPELYRPPPFPLAEFPLTVQLVSVDVPELYKPPHVRGVGLWIWCWGRSEGREDCSPGPVRG
jgi:hypothetical protein